MIIDNISIAACELLRLTKIALTITIKNINGVVYIIRATERGGDNLL